MVQQRLNNIGIGPFCLELHSNKSNKRDVLNQLDEADQAVKQDSPGAWLEKAEQAEGLRKDLDVYAQALHERHKRNDLTAAGLRRSLVCVKISAHIWMI